MMRGAGVRTRAERERLYGWVYENNQWGRSPRGDRFWSDSPPEATLPYRRFISDFIRAHEDVRRVVDLGCGDFIASAGIDMGDASFIGVDIYDALVDHLRETFGSERREFAVADLIEDPLPPGDLALVTMVLYLMSHADVQAVLAKLVQYRYVLITDGQPDVPVEDRANFDKPTDKYTPIDWHGNGFWLELPPFGLDVEVVSEHALPTGEIMRTVLLEHPGAAA